MVVPPYVVHHVVESVYYYGKMVDRQGRGKMLRDIKRGREKGPEGMVRKFRNGKSDFSERCCNDQIFSDSRYPFHQLMIFILSI